ncbi:carrier superfamily protein [Besnoitia besnoiti]|uniref:Carrier superfamily protein n=1 Tax=Besnoitia besnoiti TaxID=94643 RepID=A0A2A9MR21_BESBE|nr:carrier superfamily protein [Besnoitia besnoiti]PFH38770.1 carrier superfamily protein [Besnoitia besnoiti]
MAPSSLFCPLAREGPSAGSRPSSATSTSSAHLGFSSVSSSPSFSSFSSFSVLLASRSSLAREASASACGTAPAAPVQGASGFSSSSPHILLRRSLSPAACASSAPAEAAAAPVRRPLSGALEQTSGGGVSPQSEHVEARRARMNSGIAGAVSGIACATILQPLDVIKTQQQQQQPLSVGGARQSPSAWEACKRIRGMWGFPGFFRGLWPCLIRVGPGTGIYFYSLDLLTGSWSSVSALSQKAAQLAGAAAPAAEGPREETPPARERDTAQRLCEEEVAIFGAAEAAAALDSLLEGEAERRLAPGEIAEAAGEIAEAAGETRRRPTTAGRGARKDLEEKAPPWYNAAVGAVARGFAVVFFNPITVVKSRVESSWMSSRSAPPIRTVLAEMWRAEGPASLMRGAWPTVLRDVPFSGIFFGLYMWLRTQAGLEGGRADVSCFALRNFCCGAAAAAFASAVTHPFDVVRTRIQLHGLCMAHHAGDRAAAPAQTPRASSSGAAPRPTMMRMMRGMVREEGLLVLWRGLGARLAKRSLMSAMTWTSFEELKIFLTELKR